MVSMLELELPGNREEEVMYCEKKYVKSGHWLLPAPGLEHQAQRYKQGIKTTTATSSSTSLVSKSSNYFNEEPLLL